MRSMDWEQFTGNIETTGNDVKLPALTGGASPDTLRGFSGAKPRTGGPDHSSPASRPGPPGARVNGTIKLEMRTGRMVSQRRGPDHYVPDVAWIAGIPRASEISRLCRERIKQNDPTPSAAPDAAITAARSST